MNLFDKNNNNYVIKWKNYSFDSDAEIFDVNNNLMGRIKSKGYWSRTVFLLDLNDTKLLTVYARMKGWSNTQNVENGEGKRIGMVKEKLFGKIMMEMKDPTGNSILSMKRISFSDEHSEFEIYNSTRNEISKLTITHEIVETGKGLFKSNQIRNTTCFIKIIESNFDRQFLLGFVMGILNHIFNSDSSSGS